MSERGGRRTDAEILSELDECDNAVTRSVLKDVCVSRLRDAQHREAELLEALHRAVDLIDEFGIASTEGFWNLLAKHEQNVSSDT